jgi:hypothetical protein
MGREIRRVPVDWQHPKYLHQYLGHPLEEVFHPCIDEVYEDALARHQEQRRRWDADDEPLEWGGRRSEVLVKYPETTFEEWVGEPPDPAYYRSRKWTAAEATAFQFYETVSEGTPLSPVCKTREEMVEWLVTDGGRDGPMSRKGAEAFVGQGWAPSMIASPEHGVEMGMEFVDREAQEKAGS